jgi:hypothetical protein
MHTTASPATEGTNPQEEITSSDHSKDAIYPATESRHSPPVSILKDVVSALLWPLKDAALHSPTQWLDLDPRYTNHMSAVQWISCARMIPTAVAAQSMQTTVTDGIN